MSENIVIDIAREAIFLIIKVAAPMLIVSLSGWPDCKHIADSNIDSGTNPHICS